METWVQPPDLCKEKSCNVSSDASLPSAWSLQVASSLLTAQLQLTFTWTFLILGVKQHSDIPTASSSCLCLLAIMGRMTMGCVIQTGLHLNRGECYRSTRTTDTLDKQGRDLLIMDRRAQNFQRRRSQVRTRGLFPVFQIYLTLGPSTITLCTSRRTTGGLFLKRQATCTSPKWSRPMWATTPAS